MGKRDIIKRRNCAKYHIANRLMREQEKGFGGMELDLERLGRITRRVDYTMEECYDLVVELMDDYSPKYKVEYYGDVRTMPDGCEVRHNPNGAWVGWLLTICPIRTVD